MATRLPTATRNAKADAAVDLLDGGSGAGYIEIRSGSQPADPNGAAIGDVLCVITLADPAYGSASGGTAELAGTPRSGTGTEAAGAGTNAGWFRAYDSDDNPVFDGAVSGSGGGGELELDNISIAEDQAVNVTALDYTQPAEE